jgi:zinc-ribbon domain
MSYTYELENNHELVIENDGGETLVSLSSGSESQQQSQATGFDTGKWSKTPTLFQLKEDLVLRLETKDGPQFIRVRGDSIQRMRSEPELQAAEKLRLKKSDKAAGMTPMQPMKPLKGMEPMKPIAPMKMRMGDMQMSMGRGAAEGESEQRFCPNCGKPVDKGDRVCGSCGKEVRRRQ